MLSSLWLVMALAPTAAAPSENPEPFRYRGLCEASAAAVIGPNRFAVASDDSKVIRIYERGKPDPIGEPIAMGEVEDLEGAAVIGNRILWVTSHSLTKKGKDQSERKQLIETSIAGGGLVVGNRYGDLRSIVATLLEVPSWPLEASLNIEGMAATPEGDLLLGLRAPLRGEREEGEERKVKAAVALVPDPLASPARAAARPRLWWLDLDGRGIRSLERVGAGAHAYLIVAGPTGEGGPDFALFWWDGTSNAVTPEPTVTFKDRLTAVKGLASTDVVPEAAIRWEDGTIQLLGDNEANCEEKKPGPWFPSVEVRPGL